MDLVTATYRSTARFPKEEQFGLTSQLRRAAVSIPSNIAEGQGRLSEKEFRYFLGQARGSLMEVETQLQIAKNLGIYGSRTNEGTARVLRRGRSNPKRTDGFHLQAGVTGNWWLATGN
jgi:four helix bundle protein